MLSRRNMLLWIFLVALAVRALFVATRGDELGFPDSRDYDSIARSVIRGGGYREAEGRQASRAPGYPLFLALCYKVGLDRPGAVYAVQAAAGAGMCVLLALLGYRLFGQGAGIAAGWISAFYPFLVYFTGLLLAEALFAAGLVGYVLLLVRCDEGVSKGSWRRVIEFAMAAGLAAGLLTHLRSSFLLFPVFVLPFWLLRTRGRWKATAAWVLTIVLTAAVMAPWVWRNYRVFGRFVPTTLQVGESLYEANSPYADGGPAMDRIDWLRERNYEPMGEYENNEYFKAKALRYIGDHPRRFLQLAVVKLRRFWNVVPNFEDYRRPFYVAVSVGSYGPVLLLALLGIWVQRRAWRTTLFLLSPVLYYTLMHMVFVGSLRYRVPVIPLVLVLAGVGADLVWGKIGRPSDDGRPAFLERMRWKWWAAGLVVVIAASLWWAWRTYSNPERLRAMAAAELTRVTGGEVTVGGAGLSLTTGLVLRNVRVQDTLSGKVHPVFEAGTVILRPSWSSLLRGTVAWEAADITSVEIHAGLDASGRWPFLKGIRLPEQGGGSRPSIFVHDARVRISPAGEGGEFPAMDLAGLNATLIPAGPEGETYSVEVWSDEWRFGRPRMSAEISPGAGRARGRVFINGLAADRQMRERLPQRFRKYWDDFSPRGLVLDIRGNFSWEKNRPRRLEWDAVVTLHDGRFRWTGFPYEVSNVRASVVLDGRTFRVDRFAAAAGKGVVSGEGRGGVTPEGKVSGEATLRVQNLSLDEMLYRALPPKLRREWAGVRPLGRVSVLAHVAKSPEDAAPQVTAEVHLQGCAFTPAVLPECFAEINGVSGRLVLSEHVVRLRDVTGRVGEARFTIDEGFVTLVENGAFRMWGGISGLELRGSCRRLLTKALWSRLPADMRDFLDAWSLEGKAEIRAQVARPGTARPIEVAATVTAEDLTLSHPRLGKPLRRVRTRARLTESYVELSPSSAMWGKAKIETGRVRIAFSPTEEQTVRVRVRNLPMDRGLRSLVTGPLLRKTWDDFAPKGEIEDMRMTLTRSPGAGVLADGVLRFRDCAFTYRKFPYPVYEASGRIEFRKSRFHSAMVDGRNGPARLHLELYNEPYDGGDGRRILIDAGPGPMDAQLRAALRPEYQKIWDRVRPEGTLHFRMQKWFPVRAAGRYRYRADAEVSDLTLDCGLKVKARRLRVAIDRAESDAVEKKTLAGRFRTPQLLIQKERLTDVEASFFSNSDGAFVRGLTATYWGGGLTGSIDVTRREGEDAAETFHADFRLTEADLAGLAAGRNLKLKELAGLLDATAEVTGKLGEPPEIRCKGRVDVRDGRIARLPALFALLNLLWLQWVDAPAFHSVELDYEYDGDRFEAGELNLIGSVLSLYGSGRVAVKDKALDFRFRPELGRSAGEIPGLSQTLNFIKNRVVWIHLGGTLDKPVWDVDPLFKVLRFVQGNILDLIMLKPLRKKPGPQPAPQE